MQHVNPYPVMDKNTVVLTPFTLAHTNEAIQLWNRAFHPDYPINERLLRYNRIPATGEVIDGRVAILHSQPVGFVLACALTDRTKLGWISAMAVQPSAQRQGIGSELLAWAERWLKERGCQRIRIGGNYRPFVPGLPYVMRENTVFFEKHGYQSPPDQPCEYDIARSLKDYRPIYPRPA